MMVLEDGSPKEKGLLEMNAAKINRENNMKKELPVSTISKIIILIRQSLTGDSVAGMIGSRVLIAKEEDHLIRPRTLSSIVQTPSLSIILLVPLQALLERTLRKMFKFKLISG